MRIAVASGKGGTGKTTVATSLALSLARTSDGRTPPLLLDCDVENPNAHIYLNPSIVRQSKVTISIPAVDPARCSRCGRCVEVCQYHALALVGKELMVFPQLCHGCGSCVRQCPDGALSEIAHPIGMLEAGPARGGVRFARGVLQIGEPMAAPVIRALKGWSTPEAGQVVILDAPPGSSCPVVEVVRGADFLLLVTEPTPFGLHDLRLAVELGRQLGMPSGVVLNRDGIGDDGVEGFCQDQALPILMRIPFERAIAQGTARGRTLIDIHSEYTSRFRDMVEQMRDVTGVTV
ncbi:MAG: ATP-binding protein [Chloroflexota bacterium]